MVIRNQRTEEMLCVWLSMSTLPNLLLTGKKGSGKFTTACELLKEIFGTEKPYLLPYVHLIQPTEKGLITKAQVDKILELAEYRSTERHVFVIDDANTMSGSAQNALLKILEDQEGSCLFIMVAHEPMIPTIASRCMQIPFGMITREQAKTVLPEVDRVIWAGADETVGGYLRLRESEHYLEKAHEVKAAVFHGNRLDVLESCGLLKEKDPGVLTELLSGDELRAVLYYLKSEFAEALFKDDESLTIHLDHAFVTETVSRIQRAVYAIQSKQFHATELFELMLFISSRKDR